MDKVLILKIFNLFENSEMVVRCVNFYFYFIMCEFLILFYNISKISIDSFMLTLTFKTLVIQSLNSIKNIQNNKKVFFFKRKTRTNSDEKIFETILARASSIFTLT